MNRYFFNGLCILMIIAEMIILGAICRKKTKKFHVSSFISALIVSAVAIVGYGVSINSGNYFVISLANSIYFCSIDAVLLITLDLIIEVTNFKMHPFQTVTRWMARIYAIFDGIVLLINPFKEIAIHYTADPDVAYHWIYEPKVLYLLHLALCYIIIIMITYCLVLKIISTPALFRIRYSLILGGLLFIVLLNCVFLFLQPVSGFKYDISVLLYGFMCLLIYYNTFHFAERALMRTAPRRILESLNYPMILFDYEKNYVVGNKIVENLIKKNPEDITMDELISQMGVEGRITENTEKTSFQLIYDKKLLRCDYQTLTQRNKLIGYLFSFMEVSMEYDMLTGFHTAAAAVHEYALRRPEIPSGVLVCDLNRLSIINSKHGHSTGDKAISCVADLMRKECPEGTYFIRFHDATLMAVVPKTTISDMKKICSTVTKETGKVVLNGENLALVCAFSMCTNARPKIRDAINSAEETIRIKKMMDSDSAHSSLLFSLAKVMQEADPGTEQHVMRTRLMGEKLAECLKLDDEQSANLSLLCLLHDVGKLCIPLEILNKPDKLTKPEWEMLKTHTQKGYQIAKASRELSPLADLILHHHEYWDGTGYPGGLAKEEIPLLSRIISIVDAYDAMTNDRAYKKAIAPQAALEEIERCSGTQFDPVIANAFCEMVRSQENFREEKLTDSAASDVNTAIDVHSELSPEKIPDTEEMNVQSSPVRFSRYFLGTDGETVISADEHFEYLTGYTLEDIKAGAVKQSMFIYPEDQNDYYKLQEMLFQRDKEAFIEHRLRMKDGVCRNVYCHGWSYYDVASKELHFQIIITDLTESATVKKLVDNEKAIAKHNQSMWKESLRRDVLTGLLNRAAFGNDLQEVLNSDSKISVMLMCDIDFFKQYNDSKGHAQGDELLKDFAHLLTDHISDNGLVCRMGGDEFAAAVFFEKGTDLKTASEEVKRLWDEIDTDISHLDSGVSVSMGATFSIGKKKNFAQMYDEADKALYLAKARGKKQLAFFE